MGCKKQGAKKQGLDFFAIQKEKRLTFSFFKLQIASRKNMIQTLKIYQVNLTN